uniref:Uncharacterized protein n=1 Tax=viral metagenome TaxID=1070528 RepID=A0A6C0CQ64_9ZZZZ
MNISRGKIKKLRRSKSQSRRKLPKNKKNKRPRTGQNRSFRKKKYINLKNSSLKKLGKKRRRIRFQRGGFLIEDMKPYIPNENLLEKIKESEEGKKYIGNISQEGDTADDYTNNVFDFKRDISDKQSPEEWLTLFKSDKSPFKKFFENIELNEFEGNDSVVEDEDTVPYDSQEQLPTNIESQQEQEVVVAVSKEEEANEEEPPIPPREDSEQPVQPLDASNYGSEDIYKQWLKYRQENLPIQPPCKNTVHVYKKVCVYIKTEINKMQKPGADHIRIFNVINNKYLNKMYAQRRIQSKSKSSQHMRELINLDFEKLVEHYFHVLVYYSNKNNEDINEKLDKLFESNKSDAYTDDIDKNGNKIHMINKSIPKWKFNELRKKYPYEYVYIPTSQEKNQEEQMTMLKELEGVKIETNKYFESVDKLHSSHSKLENYVREKGNVSLGKTPAITLLKQGNLFRVKYRYPFIPGSFEQNYSTEMNTNTLTFNPGTVWKDKPKPSKTSMIPFKTKHDEAQYVKVVFNVNLKTPNKSKVQKFVIHVPKTSLTFNNKISEVNLQFKDLYEPKNNKIINGKKSKDGVKFYKPLDILIPGVQDCMANSVDSGVFSSLESIKARQAKEANQRINKLKIDLRKSKMNEGDATLCTNKIRDMEADLLENNAMTISYDPASKNVYVSKVENLTDFAESLKINLEELHDIDNKKPDLVSNNTNVGNNNSVGEMSTQQPGSNNSSTIHTPSFIKKAMGPKNSSSSYRSGSSGSSSSGSSSSGSSLSGSEKPKQSNDKNEEDKKEEDKKEEGEKEEGKKEEGEKDAGEKEEGKKEEGEKEEGEKEEDEKIDTDIESEIVAVVEAHKTNETTIPEPSKSIENPESNN